MKSNKALPVDIEDVTFTIFKYCSTEEFVSFVSFMANMRLFKTNKVVTRMTYDDLLLSLENKFTDLRAQEKWMAKVEQPESGMTLSNGNENPNGSKATGKNKCFNCNKVGCSVDKCLRD